MLHLIPAISIEATTLISMIAKAINLTTIRKIPSLYSNGIITSISQLVIIDVVGEDAETFLHNMLSNDVLNIKKDEVRTAAFCSYNARVIATVDYWKIDTNFNLEKGIRLSVSADLCDEIVHSLHRFKLRSKVNIIYQKSAKLIGYSCPKTSLANAFTSDIFLSLEENRKAEFRINKTGNKHEHGLLNTLTLLRFKDVEFQDIQLKCYLIIFHIDHLNLLSEKKTNNNLSEKLMPKVTDSLYWSWLNIRSGKIQIEKKISNLFTPQMLNLDLIGAVNFKKGCYPGQEVVARTHYLGKIKRRLKLIHASKAKILENIYCLKNLKSTLAGRVLMVAPAPTGGFDFLAELIIDSNAELPHYLEENQNETLNFLKLPYKISS